MILSTIFTEGTLKKRQQNQTNTMRRGGRMTSTQQLNAKRRNKNTCGVVGSANGMGTGREEKGKTPRQFFRNTNNFDKPVLTILVRLMISTPTIFTERGNIKRM